MFGRERLGLHQPSGRQKILERLGIIDICPADVCPEDKLARLRVLRPELFPTNDQEFYLPFGWWRAAINLDKKGDLPFKDEKVL